MEEWSGWATRGQGVAHSLERGELRIEEQATLTLGHVQVLSWPAPDDGILICTEEQPGCIPHNHRCWEGDRHSSLSREGGMGRESSTGWEEGRRGNVLQLHQGVLELIFVDNQVEDRSPIKLVGLHTVVVEDLEQASEVLHNEREQESLLQVLEEPEQVVLVEEENHN